MAACKSSQKTIENDLIELMQSGKIPVSGKLPSLSKLAKRYKVSTTTAYRAFLNLEKRGYISIVGGKGAYATDGSTVKRKVIRSNCISFICPNMTGSYISEIARGIERTISKEEYYLAIFDSLDDFGEERENLKKAIEIGSKAIILFPVIHTHPFCPNNTAYTEILQTGIPFVFVDNYPLHLNVNCVCGSDYQGVYDLTRYVIEMGHKRIAFIGGPTHVSSFNDRHKGYLKAIAETNGQADVLLAFPNPTTVAEKKDVLVTDFLSHSGCEFVERLMSSANPPSALIITNFYRGFLDILKRRDLTIPDDLSIAVMGMESSEEETLYPQILQNFMIGREFVKVACCIQPAYTLGEKAAEIAMENIEGKAGETPIKINIDMPLYAGNSVKKMGKSKQAFKRKRTAKR